MFFCSDLVEVVAVLRLVVVLVRQVQVSLRTWPYRLSGAGSSAHNAQESGRAEGVGLGFGVWGEWTEKPIAPALTRLSESLQTAFFYRENKRASALGGLLECGLALSFFFFLGGKGVPLETLYEIR